MRQVLNPAVEQTEATTQTDGDTTPVQVCGTGSPQHTKWPSIAKCHKKPFTEELAERLGGEFGYRELLLSVGKPARYIT